MINIRHAGIVVSNLEQALEFYRDLLGLNVVIQSKLERYDVLKLLGIEDTNLIYVKLKPEQGDAVIELYYFENPEVRNTYFNEDEGYVDIAFNHISFTVPDIEELHGKLIEAGYSPLSYPSIDESCTYKLFFVRDADYNLLEFVQRI